MKICPPCEMFLRMKKSLFIWLIFLVTFGFLLIQVLFLNDLKLMFSTKDTPFKVNQQERQDYDLPDRRINPKFDLLLRQKSTSTDLLISNDFKWPAKQRLVEIDIPLDDRHRPYLINLLPFYNKKNYFNFSTRFVLVDSDESQTTTTTPTTGSKGQFLNIESENRRISLREDWTLTESKSNEQVSLRGINKQKASLYQSDSDGMFKCLNSNVKYFLIISR